jgi:serine/threonine protein kinase
MSRFDSICRKLSEWRLTDESTLTRARSLAGGDPGGLLAALANAPAWYDPKQKTLTEFQAAVLSGREPGPPLRLGDYLLQRLLGKGGMGAVYQAHDLVRGRTVAAKIMTASDSVAVRRFRKEFDAMRELDGLPGVVRAIEQFEHEQFSVLVMEYQNKGDLYRLVTGMHAAGQTLSCRQVARWMLTLLEGLSAAHARGFVHRDIKPHNVMIHEAEKMYVRLADWGVVRVVDQATIQTTAGEVIGTYDYLPPEMWRGADVATSPAADVYSLGCTVFFALTGRPPYWFPNVSNPLQLVSVLCNAHQNHATPRLVEARPDVPVPLNDVVLRMMDKLPSNRPTTESLKYEFKAILNAPDAPAIVATPAPALAAKPSIDRSPIAARTERPAPTGSPVVAATTPKSPRDLRQEQDAAVPLRQAAGGLIGAVGTWMKLSLKADPMRDGDAILVDRWRTFATSATARWRTIVAWSFVLIVLLVALVIAWKAFGGSR